MFSVLQMTSGKGRKRDGYGGVFFFSQMARRRLRRGPWLSSSSSSSNNPGQWKAATGNKQIFGNQGGGGSIGGRTTLLHYGGRAGRSRWAMDVYSASARGINNLLRDPDLCLGRVYWTGLGPPPDLPMTAVREAPPLAGEFSSMCSIGT